MPKEIATTSAHIATYARLLEHGLRVGLAAEDFISSCIEEGLPITETERHEELFKELMALERANKNGLWARIIKNAFAPLFAGRFEFIAGNPPWVNWEHLPAEYRALSEPIWRDYSLIGQVPGQRRQQSRNAKTDVSMLMAYVSCDRLLTEKGRLGFVITRSVFQAELGGWHFRRFRLPEGQYLSVNKVFDLDALKPFRGQAANLTCTFFVTKGRQTSFPVAWFHCVPKDGHVIAEDDTLEQAVTKMSVLRWIAAPIDLNQPQSPWLFGDKEAISCLSRIIGPSAYARYAREGVNTRGANGVYFVNAQVRGRHLFVHNMRSEGDDQSIPDVDQSIEPDYVYPLLRGRDVRKWVASPSGYIVMPHDDIRPAVPVSFSALPTKTREFLATFRDKLAGRRRFRNFDPAGEEWYGLYSVLEATFAPFKVVWREMATGTLAAIVPSARLPTGNEKVTIPDHKLFLIPCSSEEEALFVCGFFNSPIASYIVRSYALSTGISTHVLERIPIPTFMPGEPQHRAVLEAAKACRSAAIKRAEWGRGGNSIGLRNRNVPRFDQGRG